jgi:hypothetical protein
VYNINILVRAEIQRFITTGSYGILNFINNIRKIIKERKKYIEKNDKLFIKKLDGLTLALYVDREIHNQLFHGYGQVQKVL